MIYRIKAEVKKELAKVQKHLESKPFDTMEHHLSLIRKENYLKRKLVRLSK
jgi:hypothetical protein